MFEDEKYPDDKIIKLAQKLRWPISVLHCLIYIEGCELMHEITYKKFQQAFNNSGKSGRKWSHVSECHSSENIECILAPLPEQQFAIITGDVGLICKDKATTVQVMDLIYEAPWSRVSDNVHYIFAIQTGHYLDLLNSFTNILFNVEGVVFPED